MNTLKIECSKNDYVIWTAEKVNLENEFIVEVPVDWNCDYVNAVLWEDDICEMFEKGDDRILLIPKCGELLLKVVKEDDEKKYILIPLRYDDQALLIVKI